MDAKHSVPTEDAHANQFYVVEQHFPEYEEEGVFDPEDANTRLLLTGAEHETGDSIVIEGPVSDRVLEIIEGPYNCPPLPHVQQLRNWVVDTDHSAAEYVDDVVPQEYREQDLSDRQYRCGRCDEVNGQHKFQFDDRSESIYAVPACPTCNYPITNMGTEEVNNG